MPSLSPPRSSDNPCPPPLTPPSGPYPSWSFALACITPSADCCTHAALAAARVHCQLLSECIANIQMNIFQRLKPAQHDCTEAIAHANLSSLMLPHQRHSECLELLYNLFERSEGTVRMVVGADLMHVLWEADVAVFKAHITTGPSDKVLDLFWIYDNKKELPENHRSATIPLPCIYYPSHSVPSTLLTAARNLPPPPFIIILLGFPASPPLQSL